MSMHERISSDNEAEKIPVYNIGRTTVAWVFNPDEFLAQSGDPSLGELWREVIDALDHPEESQHNYIPQEI